MSEDTPPKPPPPRPEGCEHCTKPCSVFFTHVSAAGAAGYGMCAECPKAKVLLNPTELAPLSDAAVAPAGATATPRCPSCGFTLEDFGREKRFGCPLCYQTFGDFVHRVLEFAQPALTHAGKHPAKHHGALTLSRLEAARTELKQAVAKEDFESAAKLRDEIHALESSLQKPPLTSPPATPPTGSATPPPTPPEAPPPAPPPGTPPQT